MTTDQRNEYTEVILDLAFDYARRTTDDKKQYPIIIQAYISISNTQQIVEALDNLALAIRASRG